jgi:hypothetical protein
MRSTLSRRATTDFVLYAAADLLEPAGAWTQKAYARDVHGELTSVDRGVCFDPVGALARVIGVHPSEIETTPAYQKLEAALGCEIPVWNDRPERTQAEVVDAFRKAAAGS